MAPKTKKAPRPIPGQAAARAAAEADSMAAEALRLGELKTSESQVQTGQFKEEAPEVWEGYVEWEKYPEKKAVAHKLMTGTALPPPPGTLLHIRLGKVDSVLTLSYALQSFN